MMPSVSPTTLTHAVALLLVCLLAACGGSESGTPPATTDAAPADAPGGSDGATPTLPDGAPAADTPQAAADATTPGREGSRYQLELSLPANREMTFSNDLDEVPNAIVFGSTHIAPAISLAVRDTRYDPAYAVITLDFGIISGSPQHPVQTPDKGEYLFGVNPPSLEVNLEGIPYTSTTLGAEGKIVLTNFSTTMGGLVDGTISGTLEQVTTSATKGKIGVEGSFRIILPKPQGGPGS